jgi:hypothetical protein
MEDLQRLMKLRGMKKLPPGRRNEWMFVAALTSSYLVAPEALEKKMFALGQEVADWSEAETRSCISTVLSRAHAASDGKTLEWQGQQRSVRYWRHQAQARQGTKREGQALQSRRAPR